MKGSESFKKTIEDHLKALADKDPQFAEKFNSEKKNIDDCVTYILNQVKKSGCNGFSDAEIFGMATHYYDEEKIDIGKKISNGSVIVNHKIELTESEIEEAKKLAKEKIISEERERLTKRVKPTKVEKAEEPNLFDNV